MSLFDFLGVLLALYTLLAIARGRVHAKDGWRMRELERDDTPVDFWTVIALYALLSLALVAWF